MHYGRPHHRSHHRGTVSIGRRDLDQAHRALRDAHAHLASSRDESSSGKKDVKSKLVETGAVAAGAAATGMLTGYLGSTEIGSTGVPWGLALGVAGHALQMFAPVGSYGKHIANAADGAIASWVNNMAVVWGAKAKARAAQPPAPPVAGIAGIGACTVGCPTTVGCPPPALPYPSYVQPATEAELAAMSYGVR